VISQRFEDLDFNVGKLICFVFWYFEHGLKKSSLVNLFLMKTSIEAGLVTGRLKNITS